MSGGNLLETIGGLPNICGAEDPIGEAMGRPRPIFLSESGIDFGRIKSAFAIALHMHQPLIPAGGSDLSTARIISNLQYMYEHPEVKDAHNAPAFAHRSVHAGISGCDRHEGNVWLPARGDRCDYGTARGGPTAAGVDTCEEER
jgi:hypothetical protein